MRRFGFALGAFVAAGAATMVFQTMPAGAATKAERSRAAAGLVEEALWEEVEGDNGQRESLLHSALEQSPDYAPARWHTGHVQEQDRWLRFDEVPDTLADDLRVAAYERRRLACRDTAADHLALAEWCGERNLRDRQRAHLTRVLEIEPEHAEARRLLGYRRVEGAWLSAEEIAEAAQRAQDAAAALARWKPRIDEILEGLQHRSRNARDAAKDRLLEIDDPAAIYALELVLCGHSEQTALMAIEVLAKMRGEDASAALARQAVFSPWNATRQAAAEALRPRDPAGYVPLLLSAMSTPVQTRAALYRAPCGRLMYRHALYRERQQHAELAVFETDYRRTLLSPGDQASYVERRRMLQAARLQDAVEKARALEVEAARQNAVIGQINERICWVLFTAIGLDLPATAEAWWNWWNEYNEVYVAGEKPVVESYHHESVRYEDPRPVEWNVSETEEIPYKEEPKPFPGGKYGFTSFSGSDVWRDREGYYWAKRPWGSWDRLSCLVAGTLVWTDGGAVPIERIEIGDRVLSQDPETGELAYKPVLKTTLRPPGRLFKLVVDDKALQSSGGHLFWVAGHGWVKARELKEGMRLHTVDGFREVRSLHPTGAEALYNLVVADFHTYFVTEDRLLTHDNTIRTPVERIVPGLAKR